MQFDDDTRSLGRDLFDQVRATITIGLALYLDKFVSELPPGHQYKCEQVILDHTLLPIYVPFLRQSQTEKLIEGMRRKANTQILTINRLMPVPEYLR